MGVVKKIFDMINPAEEDFDDQEQFEALASEKSNLAEREGNVIKFGKVPKKLVISCFKPKKYDSDISKITDSLLSGNIAVLDLGMEIEDSESARRIIDFVCGSVYAIGGKVARVAKSAYVLTPRDVEVNGAEVVNRLNDSGIYF